MKKRIASFICFFLSTCFFSACTPPPGAFNHPDFSTKYTKEEHVERIKVRVEEANAESIKSGYLLSYEVHILYAFYDGDPEYFLIEYFFREDRKIWNNRLSTYIYNPYHYTIGFIKNDTYYTALPYYGGIGMSPYRKLGYTGGIEHLKLYGKGVCGVVQDGNCVLIDAVNDDYDDYEVGYILSVEERKDLMPCYIGPGTGIIKIP